jgi:hypothetical protein
MVAPRYYLTIDTVLIIARLLSLALLRHLPEKLATELRGSQLAVRNTPSACPIAVVDCDGQGAP